MINTFRLLSRQNLHQLRQIHKCVVRQTIPNAAAATTSSSPPVSTNAEKPVDPKIEKIFNDIVSLNLVEVLELVDVLSKRLNLPDRNFAPVMPVGFMPAQAAETEEEEATQKRVKTDFTVKLVEFDTKQKIALIKEIKSVLPDTNLVQAKKFVESAPVVIKEDIPKEEAEKLRDALHKVGATIEIL